MRARRRGVTTTGSSTTAWGTSRAPAVSARPGLAWASIRWFCSLTGKRSRADLVDDSTSNTYRALRFVGSEKHGNTLYAEFTAVEDWHFQADLFIEMYDLDNGAPPTNACANLRRRCAADFLCRADPHELHNLASQASPALKAELHQMVLEQFGCQGTQCT